MKHLDVYTDGSYNKDMPEFTYGAFVSDVASMSVKTSISEATDMWNVGGELLAAITALTFIQEMAKHFAENGETLEVNIYSDYEGVVKWASGAWKTKKPLTKAYRKFYLDIANKNPNLRLNLMWVKGHSTTVGNNQADELARKGLSGSQDCKNMDDLIIEVLRRV